MGINLVEAMKLARAGGDVEKTAVIAMFARASDLLAVWPFSDIDGNAWSYNREGTLPGIAFRGVNEAYTESTGIINPRTETLRIIGGDLDLDTFIEKTGGSGIRETHENMKIKAMAADVTRVLIKGDAATQPREFDGLQVRLTGSQLIEDGNTNGGDALSLAKLDEAIDQTTSPTHLIMNKAMRRRITAAARNSSIGGHIDFAVDAFGRRITVYADVPILVAYSDDGGTDPIAFDEVGGGGATATATSIYVVSLGDGMVKGIQNGGIDVRNLGEQNSGPQLRTRVEWFVGMAIEHGRAATRLRGISDAAVVV